jgi:hypothetical protein
MSLIDIDSERHANPVDVIEHVAALEDWSFERSGDDEITISVTGRWSDYHASFSWMEEVEALHLTCAFDLKVAEPRRGEAMKLLAAINEQMWLGHFDLWNEPGVVVFRHGLLLAGGVEPGTRQVEAMLTNAIEACDRYYQAFQFVVWAGKTAREAIDSALFETAGEA